MTVNETHKASGSVQTRKKSEQRTKLTHGVPLGFRLECLFSFLILSYAIRIVGKQNGDAANAIAILPTTGTKRHYVTVLQVTNATKAKTIFHFERRGKERKNKSKENNKKNIVRENNLR